MTEQAENFNKFADWWFVENRPEGSPQQLLILRAALAAGFQAGVDYGKLLAPRKGVHLG